MSISDKSIPTGDSSDSVLAGQTEGAHDDDQEQRGNVGWAFLDWMMLFGVMAVALIVRLIYNQQLQASPFFEHPALDAELHVDWAMAIAEGRSLFEGVYARAPLYPWLLGILYSIIGVDYVVPRVLGALMGTVSCGLLFAIAHRFFGRSVALLAGLVAATYWVLVFFDGELLVEPLSVFLNLLGIWILVRAKRPGYVGWFLAGLCFGLSALNRPNVLLVVPLLACWPVIIFGVTQWKRWAAPVVLFCGACALVILPVTVRNYVKGGEAVLIASNGGFNFYVGNNPQSDGMSALLPGVRPDWWGGMQDAASIAQAHAGQKLTAGQVSRFYYRAGLRFIRDEPGLAFRLFLHKLRFFWNDVEIPNPYNLYFFTDKYTPIVRFLPLTFGMLVPFACVGVVLTGRKKLVGQFPLWGFALAYMASIVAFFVTSRFRLPIVPVVILYAAFGFLEMLRLLAHRKWFPVVGSVVAVVLMWPLLHTEDIAALKDHPVSYCKVARSLSAQENYIKAEEACRKAIAIDPELALAYEILGNLELSRGNVSAGIVGLKRAIQLDEGQPVYVALADALIHQDRFSEASRTLQKGIKALPGQLELKVRLVGLLSTCPDPTVRNGRKALSIADELLGQVKPDATFLDARAAALAELGRFDEAIAVAKKALGLVGMSEDDVSLRRGIAERLKTYESRRPYRED